MGNGSKPALVVMAAGMGSRYGGLKQIDPVDSEGHIIMDFSLYDARKAGFDPAVMASPFITTIVDAISLMVYFQIAASLLGL